MLGGSYSCGARQGEGCPWKAVLTSGWSFLAGSSQDPMRSCSSMQRLPAGVPVLDSLVSFWQRRLAEFRIFMSFQKCMLQVDFLVVAQQLFP
eukprot:1160141-Pelagomonas_calceolata.AAC.1